MKIDHIHFIVEDAKQTCRWLIKTMGWRAIGSAVLPDRILEILEYRGSRFIFSSPRSGTGPLARHLMAHGQGVVDVALEVEDPESLHRRLCQQHVPCLQVPPLPAPEICFVNRPSPVVRTWIQGWGSLGHTLVRREGPTSSMAAAGIDHIVLNVNCGERDRAVAFYRQLLALEPRQNFGIATERSSMKSTVLHSGDGHLYFNINEPSSANSQIQQFIDANGGAGIQHIALRGDPLIPTVAGLVSRGLAMLKISGRYYTLLGQRLQRLPSPRLSKEEWEGIRHHNILIDWMPESPDAWLLQTFSQPPFTGSLFFFEFIERWGGAGGFGENNFQELYEAVETEMLGSS